MQLFRDSNHPVFAQDRCVATIGSFDGLHRGHQAVMERLRAWAEQLRLPSTVVLFEPLPAEFFQAQDTVRICTLRQRLEMLKALGIERVLCLRFNQDLAALPPETFIQTILVDGLHVRGLLIGEDFQFGKARAGNKDTLKDAAKEYGFVVQEVPAVRDGQRRISSSWLREVIREGGFAQAERLLGRAFEISGRVIHGDKQGTVLGFPTANLACGRTPTPLHGVYTGAVTSLGALRLCLINAGYRPTFQSRQYRVEVHIPDFSADLYSHRLTVRLIGKVRDEQRFDSIAALKRQIHRDLEALAVLNAGTV